MELRDYQADIAADAAERLERLRFVYLAMEVRTGKTLTALDTSRLLNFKKVLFITKKKPMDGVYLDYYNFEYTRHFTLEVINTESVHKAKIRPDLVISDEHHKYGAFPKPSKGFKVFKEMFRHLPVICLSGTPSPESYSQLYHQCAITDCAPFVEYDSFYRWADKFVDKRQVRLPHGIITDYSRANKAMVMEVLDPYFITYTQSQAGFDAKIDEKILWVDLEPSTLNMIERLKRSKVLQGADEVVLADTGAKLMQKVHQLCSGTVKFESGNAKVIDYTKAEYIRDNFVANGKKLAIFYKFKAELEAIKARIDITEDLAEFNTTDKSIALQIVSGREGINLSKADSLVYYNIDFSAVSYWQSRDRLTTMDRKQNTVYWLFSRGGIEQDVYAAVQGKRDYTLSIFEKRK